MRSFANTSTAVESSGSSNRRQPVRQTRTNPARTSLNVTLTANFPGDAQDGANEESPGFFPAITHFTDAITALPKEMIRHYTMLKEVDAKIYGPEERLGQLLSAGLRAPVPRPADSQADTGMTSAHVVCLVLLSDSRILEPLPEANLPESKHPRFARRNHFLEMRRELANLLMTLDEKNHVMSTAIDGLEKQLKRCQSSYPHIEGEISEEARLGSMTHWAYNTEKPTEKKGIMAGERTRRAANQLAAAEGDAAAMRSEARREAVAARKGRNQNFDSDFDDNRIYGKKAQNGGKGRKAADTAYGLGISNASAPPNKRRKVEQTNAGGVAMGRSFSSTYGSGARGASPAVDTKRKARGGALATGNGRRRQALDKSHPFTPSSNTSCRGNTNTSGINSPNLASSPVVGTFTSSSKDRQGRSPAPSLLQRVPSSRNHQTTSQSRMQVSHNRSSSTTTKQRTVNGNSNGLHNTPADVEKVSGLTGKTTDTVRANMKETINSKGEHMIEDTTPGGGGDGAADMRGALVVGSGRNGENGSSNHSSRTRDRPPSISVSTRGGGGGNGNGNPNSKSASKSATPLTATFNTTSDTATSHRARPPRNVSDLPIKRSHKKGAGIAAQMAAAAAAAAARSTGEDEEEEEDDAGHAAEEEEEEEGEGGEEPRYCYCNDFSYGEMVGCDAEDCKREWFHLHCVGLNRAPARTGEFLFFTYFVPFLG